MSAGAYVLVRFDNREKLIPALEVLGNIEQVARWDAVDGHHNLVLKLKSNDPAVLEKIRGLEGLSTASSCELLTDAEGENAFSPDFAYSYVFIETDHFKQKAVQSALEKNEAVAFCSSTSGACDLVAMVRGESFDLIDRTIDHAIRPLDGVVRLKQERVILLDRM